MKHGHVVGYNDLTKAIEGQAEFHRLAALTAPLGDFASYGMTCVVDEERHDQQRQAFELGYIPQGRIPHAERCFPCAIFCKRPNVQCILVGLDMSQVTLYSP